MKQKLKHTVLTLVALGAISTLGSAQGIWEQAGEAPVPGGTGQAIAATSDGVFVICQLCEITETRFFEFVPNNTDEAEMRNTDNLPEAAFRDGSALVWDERDDGYLYALLGSRSPGEGDLDRRFFYRYSLNRDRWERLPDTPFPQGDGNALVYTEVEDNREIYALLGSNVDRSDDLDLDQKSVLAVFDLNTLTWDDALIDLPDAWEDDGTSSGASLVWDRFDRIYALQGDATGSRSASFASFAPSTGRWLELENIPETTAANNNCGIGPGGSLTYLGHIDEAQSNYVYALGGGCHVGRPGSSFYRYDIAGDEWENLTRLPCPVGTFNGNRFFTFEDELYYAQSAPETAEYICGGEDIFRFELP